MGRAGSSKLGRETSWHWKFGAGSWHRKAGAGKERNWLMVTIGLVGSGVGGLGVLFWGRSGWEPGLTPESPGAASMGSRSIALELWAWSIGLVKGFSGRSLALGSGIRANNSVNVFWHPELIGAAKICWQALFGQFCSAAKLAGPGSASDPEQPSAPEAAAQGGPPEPRGMLGGVFSKF